MKKYIVYKHRNKINDRVYFGMTSQTIEDRSGINGKNYKRRNPSNDFYVDILKYGWDSFEHEILYSGLELENAKEIERNLILKNKDSGLLYNMSKGGESSNSYKRKVVQMDLESNKIVMIWKNKMEISRQLNIGHALISQCCNKVIKQAYNYTWFNYEDVDNNKLDEYKCNNEDKAIKEILYKLDTYKKIVQIDLDYNLVKTWDNANQAESYFGNNTSMILDCCNKNRNTSYGFYWKTYEDYIKNGTDGLTERRNKPKSIIQKDLDGNILKVWNSMISASRELNIGVGVICNCCKGNCSTGGGYMWEYYDKPTVQKYYLNKINNQISCSSESIQNSIFSFTKLEELQDELSCYTEYDENGKYVNPFFSNINELIKWTEKEFEELKRKGE